MTTDAQIIAMFIMQALDQAVAWDNRAEWHRRKGEKMLATHAEAAARDRRMGAGEGRLLPIPAETGPTTAQCRHEEPSSSSQKKPRRDANPVPVFITRTLPIVILCAADFQTEIRRPS